MLAQKFSTIHKFELPALVWIARCANAVLKLHHRPIGPQALPQIFAQDQVTRALQECQQDL